MAAYSGKFQYSSENGQPLSQGPCQVKFDTENCTVTPAGGIPVAFDLGDVDSLARGEWDLELKLFTGKTVALRQFGSAFSRMADELSAAWLDRTVQCLLLEDLNEVARFNGNAALSRGSTCPAEIRVYESNIAILPAAGMPIQWRLADVDSIMFDDASYSIVLQSGADQLVLSKLAKKTDECLSKLTAGLDALREKSADVLHKAFPFLDPDRLQRLLMVMPEGRSVPLSALHSIHPQLVDALLARAVDPHLKSYFDELRLRSAGDSIMTGYKFIREDEEAGEESDGGPVATAESPAEQEETPLFFWFFFPIKDKNAVAWESTKGSGRATYFFRANPPQDSAIASLTRGLALVNFRREPVYLPEESLHQQPRFHRYAIGARKLPDLRNLRATFLGRAVHSSLDKWMSQVDSAIKNAG